MRMAIQKLTQDKDTQTILALASGPLIWFLHLNLLNMLSSTSCKWHWFPFTAAGMSGLRFIETISTLFFLLLMLYIVYLPWRNWRSFQTEKPIHNPKLLQDTEEDRRPLLAFIAMLMNALLSVFVLASFFLLFALTSCPAH
jgi:hypothetical protein